MLLSRFMTQHLKKWVIFLLLLGSNAMGAVVEWRGNYVIIDDKSYDVSHLIKQAATDEEIVEYVMHRRRINAHERTGEWWLDEKTK